ncbi:MAG: hypothetical protein FJ029_10985, partial [Actinobacteria bacterium]|nr:hypothetical protein [Actinomycetota bacterium]
MRPTLHVDFLAPEGDYQAWLARVLGTPGAPHVAFGDAVTFQRHRERHLLVIFPAITKLPWQHQGYRFIPDTFSADGGSMRVPPARRPVGPAYGFPYTLSVDAWLANEVVLQTAGTPMPNQTLTWNDVVDVAKRTTDPARGQWGLLASNSPEYFWIPLLYGNGIPCPFSEDRRQTAWLVEGDAASEAFSWAVELIYDFRVAPPHGEYPALARDSGDPFSGGHIS